MKPRKYLTKNKIAPTICILMIISGTLTLYLWPSFAENLIDKQLKLSPGNKVFEIWQETPMPLSLDVYLYNWTNPQDLMNTSTKPHLVQMGPYVFVEKFEKVDIVWNDNGTITYRQFKKYHFDADRSNGTLEDNVTTLNAIAVSAAFAVRNSGYIMRRGLSFALSASVKDLHITRTAGELIFDGYQDTLMNVAMNMPAVKGLKIPKWDRFAWFYGRNATKEINGILNMATGHGKHPMGELERWNYEANTDFYSGECNKIHGTAGELFPAHRTKDFISMFSPEMCRNIEFEYDKEETFKGVRGYKYIGGPKMSDNGTLYPKNKCYCNGECIPSGVMNVSACRYGSPGFISFPHFHGADPYYLNQVDGLQPDEEKHQFHIILEPRTGIPLDVAARFQINILLQPIDDISYVQNVPKIFFPMIWFEQRVTITDDLASGLNTLLSIPAIGTTIAITMIVIGIILLLTLIMIYMVKHLAKIKQKKIQLDLPREEVPLNDNSEMKIKIHFS